MSWVSVGTGSKILPGWCLLPSEPQGGLRGPRTPGIPVPRALLPGRSLRGFCLSWRLSLHKGRALVCPSAATTALTCPDVSFPRLTWPGQGAHGEMQSTVGCLLLCWGQQRTLGSPPGRKRVDACKALAAQHQLGNSFGEVETPTFQVGRKVLFI